MINFQGNTSLIPSSDKNAGKVLLAQLIPAQLSRLGRTPSFGNESLVPAMKTGKLSEDCIQKIQV